MQVCAADLSAVAAREEQGGVRDLVRLSKAPERSPVGQGPAQAHPHLL